VNEKHERLFGIRAGLAPFDPLDFRGQAPPRRQRLPI
jgi:hypothetical protein